MNSTGADERINGFMEDFARRTGLDPAGDTPRRYLWTDAFAVCNYLGLFEKSRNSLYRDLALRLVDQVHHTLGRHRPDDPRGGWISGLPAKEGELHPTIGGLRIGKTLPERTIGEPYDERREWDQDGQYYHYLTKWMHALNRVSGVTGDPKFLTWAIELAHAAHMGFTYGSGTRKRMYWKMSTDLSRPLVPSMGQHDPLDGLVTYNEILLAANRNAGLAGETVLVQDLADITAINRGMHMATDDPLGTGGLLFDASRLTQMTVLGLPGYGGLLETVLDAALGGADAFSRSGSLDLKARYRLAFRELGLSAGLAVVDKLPVWIGNNPEVFEREEILLHQVMELRDYLPLKETIEQFWLEGKNREAGTWTDHREINTVMLATSLAPEGFLGI
jgi:hypothetical protein